MTKTQEIVQRSLPNPKRPRLSTETEAKLVAVDQRDAVCYAHAEELTAKLYALADEIKAGNAVPIPVDAWEDTSTVQHIVEARERAESGEHEAIKLETSSSAR